MHHPVVLGAVAIGCLVPHAARAENPTPPIVATRAPTAETKARAATSDGRTLMIIGGATFAASWATAFVGSLAVTCTTCDRTTAMVPLAGPLIFADDGPHSQRWWWRADGVVQIGGLAVFLVGLGQAIQQSDHPDKAAGPSKPTWSIIPTVAAGQAGVSVFAIF
jgi:hypothetical protein